MLAKKIIPRIDLDHGKCASVISHLNDPSDVVEAAAHYMQQGADELYLFDAFPSSASHQLTCEAISRVAANVNLPIMVGGAVLTQEQIADLLDSGADKVVIGSIAVRRPSFISMASRAFSSPRICVRIDTDRTNWGYRVFTGGPTDILSGQDRMVDLDLLDWARRVEELGAGEILLHSRHSVRLGGGYDIYATGLLSQALNIPVIAEGGEGQDLDFSAILAPGVADSAVTADALHSKSLDIAMIKQQMINFKIPVRLNTVLTK